MGENERFIRDQLNKMIMKRYSQPMTPEERMKGGASALPVIGDAISAYDAYQSAKQGDYIGAALNGIGALPLIPALAGITRTKNVIKNIENINELNKWMNGSKVVNESGAPLTVYHGTSSDFDKFDPLRSGISSKTGAPEGAFFFTDKPDVASSYTVQYQGDFSSKLKDGANVRPHYLSIKKPLVVNAKGNDWRDIIYRGQYYDLNELAGLAKNSGKYDGVIVKNIRDKGVGNVTSKTSTTYISFHPDQIRSAITDRIK